MFGIAPKESVFIFGFTDLRRESIYAEPALLLQKVHKYDLPHQLFGKLFSEFGYIFRLIAFDTAACLVNESGVGV